MSITPAKLAQLFCTNLKLQEYQGLAGLRFVSSSELNSLVDTKLSHLQARISRFFSDSRDFQKKQIFQPTTFVSFSLFFVFQDTKQAFRPAGSAVERKIYAAETFCVGFLKVYYK